MTAERKVRDTPVGRAARVRPLDRLFFGLGTAASIWLAVAVIVSDLRFSLAALVPLILLWLVLAYLALPRLNRILTTIYVPDYFIGRTRTSDGLLGDPLNLAARGSAEQLSTAMARAGWTMADPVDLRTSLKIVTSTLTRRSYPEAPVSPLNLFNRPQDVAFQQEVAGNPAQRHHVRFWRTPTGWPLPGGTHVDWLAAGTYDKAVGLSLFTLQITHKIEADIDIERDHIVASVTAAEPAATVEVLQDFTTSYHSRNGGGDSVHTDGNLPVLDLNAVVADPSAPPLGVVGPERMPLQIWLPALANLVVAPVVVWQLIDRWPTGGLDRMLSFAGVAGSVLVAVLALVMMARVAGARFARLVLLTLTTLNAAVHISGYTTAGDTESVSAHAFAATVSILVLIGLSSPAATRWTGELPGSAAVAGEA